MEAIHEQIIRQLKKIVQAVNNNFSEVKNMARNMAILQNACCFLIIMAIKLDKNENKKYSLNKFLRKLLT